MRFYFDVHINGKIHRDPTGQDFARIEDARDFAINLARDFIRSGNKHNLRSIARTIIEITNRRDISMAVQMFDIFGLRLQQHPRHERRMH